MNDSKLSKNVGRISAVIVALCMLMSSFVLVSDMGKANADATDGTEYVLIDTTRAAGTGALRENGIKIVEDYGSFVMAEVNGAQKQQFADANLVTEMPDLYTFNYNNIEFDIREGAPTDTLMSQAPSDEFQQNYYFVKMFGPVKSEWKDEIELTGAEIYSAVPVNSFLVKMDAGQKASVEANPHVMWVGHFDPAYKVAPEVKRTGTDTLPVTVLTFPESRDYVIAQMGQLNSLTGKGQPVLTYPSGASFSPYIQDGKIGYIRAYVDADTAAAIANINGVLRVEWYDQPKILNDIGHSYTQSMGTTAVGAPASLVAGSYGATVPIWNAGLFGTGQVAGLSDTGIVVAHNMFRDASVSPPYNSTSSTHRKVVRYLCGEWSDWDSPAVDANQDNPDDHGTHTAGSILGYDNPVSGTSAMDGMAPGAKVSFCDIGNGDPDGYVYPPNDYTVMWDYMVLDGARTQSNSWGSAYQETYTSDEAMIDQYIYDNPNMLFVWAAGNEGATGTYSIGNQAAAKNAIAVGATGSTASQTSAATASFSSRGPSYDNRLKPDVMTSGTNVGSADGDGTTGYASLQGTSMATPQAAGSVLLAAEYFEKGFYPTGAAVPGNAFDPSHSLMKALLVNSANEGSTYTNPYRGFYNTGTLGSFPAVNQGWGRIQLNNVLKFTADAKKLQVYDGDNGLVTGSFIDYKYRVTATTQDLRVTICWCDYPATPGAAIALVNNLDLTVTSPTGAVFKGNVFTGNAPGNSLPNAGTYDARNNIEHFKLASGNTNLVTGTWNIRVSGTNVPYAPQPFAIVITGALDLGWGNIQIDKPKYSETDTAQVRIEDVGAGAGPLTAHAYCAATGDWETVTCTQSGSGVYLGSMGFTLNPVTQNNSALTVLDGSTVVFFYDDVSGTTHRTYANATIDAAGPVMTNIRADEISHMSALIKWTNSENGNGTVYYGPTTSLGFKKEVARPYTVNQEIILTGLSPNTLYYYDVESWDMYGHKTRATNGGSHYTFKTAAKGDILVVISDDEGFNVTLTEQVYSIAMDNTGWSYNFWKCYQVGLPTVTEMRTYKAVIWQVGFEHYPPFDDNERPLITNYNNGGGRLWIQSHDVAWAFGDTASDFYSTAANLWMRAQCKVTYNADPTTWATMTGITGDPISGAYTGGIAYYPVRDGGAGDEIDTVAAGGSGTYVWRTTDGSPDDCAVKWISSANNGTSGVGVWGGTPTRIVTLNGEWYRFGSTGPANHAGRTDILDKTLIWLIGHDHPTATVTAPNGGETISTATTQITWTATTYGGTGILNTKLYYSPNNGQAWYLITTLTPGASPYTWTVSGLPNGDQYKVKVEVTDNGVPNLIGSDESNNVFTITSGTDNMGPNIVPGTQTARPIPVVIGGTMWFNATIDDSLKGNSPISAAEYFVDTTGGTGTGTAMNAADGSFNSVSEAVTWSGTCALAEGTHTLRMRGRDNRGNWGILENITFQVIPGSAPPPDPYEIPLTGKAANSWVFVSFPSAMSGAIQTILNDATAGDGGTVWTVAKWQNVQDPADPWKTYRTGGTANDMPTLTNTMGVWLWITANGGDQMLTLSSYAAPSASAVNVNLYAGWNMVGYPSMTARLASATLPAQADWVSVWQAASPYVTDYSNLGLVTMSAGNAYWVHVTADCTWVVNP